MPIEFACPTCRQLVRTPDGTAGKKGKCPLCGAVVQIPLATAAGRTETFTTPPDSNSPSVTPPASPSPVRQAAPGTIDFYCTACGQLVRAPANMAGKKGRCLNCQAAVQIPRQSHDLGRPANSSDTVEDLPVLSPISGLPPSTPSRPPVAAPFSSPGAARSGLTPLPSNPFANPQTPVTDDALASLSRAVAASQPIEPARPYFAPRRIAQPMVDDRGRGGLPWEQCPSMDAFGDTILTVVSAPQDAFSKMRRFGGIGNPMGFLIAAEVVSQFLLCIELAVVLVAAVFIVRGGEGWELIVIGCALYSLFGILAGVSRATVGALLFAAVLHVALLCLGGAPGGFEATYRVIAFANGSCSMLLPVPIIGPLMGIVIQPIALVYGIMSVHDASGIKAVAAFVLSAGLLLSCGGVLFSMFLLPVLLPLLRSAQAS